MPDLQRFLTELKRRRVYRAAVLYAVVGLGVLEGTDVLVPALGLPPWIVTVVAVLALLGFPAALALAWVYQVTPDGVEHTTDALTADRPGPVVPLLVGAIALAFIAFAGGWVVRSISGSGGHAMVGSSPAGERVPIAVLPFANMSGPEYAYFTDGLHDEVIARLSNLTNLRVTSRTSVLGYRDAPQPMAVVAEQLGVRAVLEGSVRRGGSTLRVTAQLIDAALDEPVWSGSYDREYSLEAILAVQEDVANEVATALRVALNGADTVTGPMTDDLEAYELYLLGRHHWNTRSAEDLRRAIELFDQAILRDSTFARAWAGRADAYAVLAAYDEGATTRETMPLAKAAATTAVTLDPSLSDAHATLGFIAHTYDWDPAAAARHFEHAVSLNPSHPPALYWQAWLLGLVGRVDEARLLNRQAVTVGPRSVAVRFNVGANLLQIGDHERAASHLTAATELEPSFAIAWLDLGTALYVRGDLDGARAAWKRFGDLNRWSGELETALARIGDDLRAARVALREAVRIEDLSPQAAIAAAPLFAVVRDTATTIALVRSAHEARLPGVSRLYQLPYLDELTAHPDLAPVTAEFRQAFSLGVP